MRNFKWSAIVFAVLFLTGVLWAVQIPTAGKVNCRSLNVRNGPGTNNKVMDVIHHGDRVTIVDVAGKWYQIDYKGSTDRFVWKAYIDVTDYGEAEAVEDDSSRKPLPTLGETDPKRLESGTPDKRSLPRNDF